MTINLAECLRGVRTAAIAGHVNPDGDCIGSCMGLYLYLRDNFPDIQADVYMQKPREVFYYIEDLDKVRTECDAEKKYDLLILLDISSRDRIRDRPRRHAGLGLQAAARRMRMAASHSPKADTLPHRCRPAASSVSIRAYSRRPSGSSWFSTARSQASSMSRLVRR